MWKVIHVHCTSNDHFLYPTFPNYIVHEKCNYCSKFRLLYAPLFILSNYIFKNRKYNSYMDIDF